jgi:hypothetical protein
MNVMTRVGGLKSRKIEAEWTRSRVFTNVNPHGVLIGKIGKGNQEGALIVHPIR